MGRGLSTPSSLRDRSVDCPRRSIPCVILAWEVSRGPRLMTDELSRSGRGARHHSGRHGAT
eukprot:185154-Prymnesium_polylepis.1